jgi:hypothetical protein
MFIGIKNILRQFLIRLLTDDITVNGNWTFRNNIAGTCENAHNGYFGVLGGARQAKSGNVDDLLDNELYNGYGIRGGSINVTVSSLGVPAKWYNFLYIPHRIGHGDDSMNYGTLLLFPMVENTSTFYIVHRIQGTNYNAISK